MQDGRECDRLRTELRRRRAQGIGRLQRMPTLHPPPTGVAPPNVDGEHAHDGPDDGQIFLVLPRRPRVVQAAATVRACVRQRGPMAFSDVARNRAVRFGPIRPTSAPTGSARRARRRAARERGGLPVHLAAGVVQLVFEPADFLAKCVSLLPVPIAIAIRPLVLAPQSLDLALLAQQLRDQFLAGGRQPTRLHATVMPWLLAQYKRECGNAARRRLPSRR